MKNSFLSSLALTAAIAFMGADVVQAQQAKAQKPAANTNSAAANPTKASAAKNTVKQIFKQDLEFEKKMLEYETKVLVQKVLNDPAEDWSQELSQYAGNHKGKMEAEYLCAMAKYMIHPAHVENVRCFGAQWMYFILAANPDIDLDKKLKGLAKSTIDMLLNDTSAQVRGVAALAVGSIGLHSDAMRDQCIDALVKASKDSHTFVRGSVVEELEAFGSEHFSKEARAALETLAEDVDTEIAEAAGRSLMALDRADAAREKQKQRSLEAAGNKTTPPAPPLPAKVPAVP